MIGNAESIYTVILLLESIYGKCLYRFLAKYHPRHLEVNKKEERKNLHSRLQVFIKLLNNGTLDETPMTVSAANAITRVMDTGQCIIDTYWYCMRACAVCSCDSDGRRY